MQTNTGTIIAVIVFIAIMLALIYLLRRPKGHERQYFAAHEVVFHVTHPAVTDSTKLVAAIENFLRSENNVSNKAAMYHTSQADITWRTRLQPPTPNSRIITFPSQKGVSFSLVPIPLVPFSIIPIRLTGHRKKNFRPNDVIRVLNGAYAELSNGALEIGDGISLESISPNWFAKILHHGGTTGGPGSWPLEVAAPAPPGRPGTRASSQTREHEFRVAAGSMKSLKPIKDRIRKGKVHVAILDTAPSNNLVQAAQGFLSAPAVASAGSSLVQYLFTPSPNFTIHPYSNPGELTSLGVYTPPNTPPPFHYEVSDHGTFTAGIIHTIAPNATVHLYEVLNSFGLGTLTSMAQGLSDAVNDHLQRGNTSLVINCSFMLDAVTQNGGSNLNQVLNITVPDNSELLTKSIRGVLTWVTGLKNVVVVAAAGNEASSGVRPYASYPAAFSGVVGVGALAKEYPTYPSGRYIPASYSNFSYDPQHKLPSDGFMTFGGELDIPIPLPMNQDPISTKGVLGVYVGDFPRRNPTNVNRLQPRPSTTSWARWAGTSFAAPIITGLLAAKPSEIVRSTTTRAGPYLTAEGENVILVEQG